MLSRRESLLDNFRFIAFGSVLMIGLTVSARTVALWPIEWDPVSGVKDFRCAVDPLNDLVNSDGAADTSPIGWNLPPNPDGNPHIFYPVSRSAFTANGASRLQNTTSPLLQQALLPIHDFTLEGFIRFDVLPTASAWQVIARSLPGSTDSDYYWMWTFRKPNDAEEKYRFQVYTGGQHNGDLGGTSFSPPEGFVGSWHHVALVYTCNHNGTGKYKVYLDGTVVLDDTHGVKNQEPIDTNPNLMLGGRDGNYLKGALDYWRLSDEALTADRFLNAGEGSGTLVPPAVRSTTVAYWKMSENADGTLDVKDYVGTANLTKSFSLNGVNYTALPNDDCAFAGKTPPNAAVTLGTDNAGCLSMQSPGSGLLQPTLGAKLLPNASFTVEGWYRPHQEQGGSGKSVLRDRGRLVCVRDDQLKFAWSLFLVTDVYGNRSFCLEAADDTTVDGGTALADGAFANGLIAAADDVWHHIALVYDVSAAEGKGVWTLSLDGTACGTVTNVRAPQWSGTAFTPTRFCLGGTEMFGISKNDTHDQVFGYYDTWRVCSAALPRTALMCVEGGEAATGVLALWPFDSNAGIVATGNDERNAYAFNGYTVDSSWTSSDAAVDGGPAITNPDPSPRFKGDSTTATKSIEVKSGAGTFCTTDRRVLDLIGNGKCDWTFETWVRRTAAIGTWELILGGCTDPGNFTSLQLNYSYRTDGFKLLNRAVGWGGDTGFANTTDAVPNDGKFHHVALVQDYRSGSETYYFLYVDGVLVSSVYSTSAASQNLAGVIFGGRTSGNYCHCAFGGTRLSDVALSTNQFLCAEKETFEGEPTDKRTLAYWSFDAEDGPDEIASQVASGYRLEVVGGTAVGTSAQAVDFIRQPDTTVGFIGDAKFNAGSVNVSGVCLERDLNLGAALDYDRPFTVEGWLKWTPAASSARVALFGTSTSAFGAGWRVSIDASGDTPRLVLVARTDSPAQPLVSSTLVSDVSGWANEWKHVALTYDPAAGNGTWKFLVDGTEVVSALENVRSAEKCFAGMTAFRIGCAADDGMTAFSGALDEWRITCGVRTAEDILFRPRKGMVLIFR